MSTITRSGCPSALVVVLLLTATGAAPRSAVAVTIPPGSLAAAQVGNDVVLTFPTTALNFYTVQTSPNLGQPWTDLQPGVAGDGTVKTVTSSNAVSAGAGFYRLSIQTPTKLLLSQSAAFAILGHSCGGIKEQTYVNGFDPDSGYPTGAAYLSTTCSTGGRGSPTHTYTAWAAVTWDFAGNTVSAVALAGGPTIDPTFSATDAYRDTIYNAGTTAYLVVPAPGAPIGVSAVQSGDQFNVSWKPAGVNPAVITSSAMTATPVGSTASVLTTTVSGSAVSGVLAPLEPDTTYQITVANTTLAGPSPPSAPLSITTSPATLLPSAPTGVAAHWPIQEPSGATDTLTATWQAADPGNSPIDEYRVTITGSDGGGTFTQTVSGTTLTASFTVDYIPNWSVTVQAHNAVGWGPSSKPVSLGGR